MHGLETPEELTWLGFAFAHVVAHEQAQRLARIERQRAALLRQRRR